MVEQLSGLSNWGELPYCFGHVSLAIDDDGLIVWRCLVRAE